MYKSVSFESYLWPVSLPVVSWSCHIPSHVARWLSELQRGPIPRVLHLSDLPLLQCSQRKFLGSGLELFDRASWLIQARLPSWGLYLPQPLKAPVMTRHKLGPLTDRNVFFRSLGRVRSKVKVSAALCSL